MNDKWLCLILYGMQPMLIGQKRERFAYVDCSSIIDASDLIDLIDHSAYYYSPFWKGKGAPIGLEQRVFYSILLAYDWMSQLINSSTITLIYVLNGRSERTATVSSKCSLRKILHLVKSKWNHFYNFKFELIFFFFLPFSGKKGQSISYKLIMIFSHSMPIINQV